MATIKSIAVCITLKKMLYFPVLWSELFQDQSLLKAPETVSKLKNLEQSCETYPKSQWLKLDLQLKLTNTKIQCLSSFPMTFFFKYLFFWGGGRVLEGRCVLISFYFAKRGISINWQVIFNVLYVPHSYLKGPLGSPQSVLNCGMTLSLI